MYVGTDMSSLVFDAYIAAEAAIKLAPKAVPITKDEALRIGEDFATLVRVRIEF